MDIFEEFGEHAAEFANELGHVFTTVAQAAGETAQTFSRYMSLSTRISTAKSDLKHIYLEIGKKTADETADAAWLAEQRTKINALKDSIAQMDAESQEIVNAFAAYFKAEEAEKTAGDKESADTEKTADNEREAAETDTQNEQMKPNEEDADVDTHVGTHCDTTNTPVE